MDAHSWFQHECQGTLCPECGLCESCGHTDECLVGQQEEYEASMDRDPDYDVPSPEEMYSEYVRGWYRDKA